MTSPFTVPRQPLQTPATRYTAIIFDIATTMAVSLAQQTRVFSRCLDCGVFGCCACGRGGGGGGGEDWEVVGAVAPGVDEAEEGGGGDL